MAIFLPLNNHFNMGHNENELIELFKDQNNFTQNDSEIIKMYFLSYVIALSSIVFVWWNIT